MRKQVQVALKGVDIVLRGKRTIKVCAICNILRKYSRSRRIAYQEVIKISAPEKIFVIKIRH